MFAKVCINGEIEVLTGLHIGAGGDFSAIGAADSPVIRDVISGLPLITGSSLKGKMRTLLAKAYNKNFAITPNKDDEKILSLFGSTDKPGKLVFSDMLLCNHDELKNLGVFTPTEVKFENTINRSTAQANPRQIERVIRQAKFGLSLVYTIDNKNGKEDFSEEKTIEDFKVITDGFKLLQYDYLGGHGSRGYGKIKFNNLSAKVVMGGDDGGLDGLTDKFNELLKGVTTNGI